ncbi:unnamed protein product [Symbiodinium necroappetens]|uniref:Methyltransferase FkbM domain-containing protein n=1 Tax=Symbiodinium necroappetens TaxID=1628268 RepID=A0A812S632_9DINO|nr:unnamed protein product [Symbiodinium necroappetens]
MKAAALFALASLAVLGVITSLRALSNHRQMLLQKTAELTASLQDRWALDIFDERVRDMSQKTDSGTAGEIPLATSSADAPGAAELLQVAAASDLWKEGSQLLGEADFVEFLSRCQRAESVLAGSRVKIWSDSRDRKGFKGAMAEQVRDVYGLSKLVKPSWGDDTWILDVGGNLGITAIHLHIRAPKSKLLTLEPSPWNYILLRLNLLQQPDAF